VCLLEFHDGCSWWECEDDGRIAAGGRPRVPRLVEEWMGSETDFRAVIAS
jgi:hypothetical protein